MIEIEVADLEDALGAISALESGSWIETELRKLIPAVGRVNKAQFDKNKSLPYSPAYVGRLKPSGLRRAGGAGDLGFGLDSLALYSDALFSFDIDDNSLTNYSDLEYAGYQAQLVENKGSSFYASDEEYFRLLQLAVESGAKEVWEE